jgi:NNP family nitrate/nitrite transporter-like MFS transporter
LKEYDYKVFLFCRGRLMTTKPPDPSRRALILGTLAFTVSFAIWGLLAGLMPILKKELSLSASQASLLVALPVVLGALGRIPAGILADRLGGKKVFTVLLFLIVLPAVVLGLVHGYQGYLAVASVLGIAGVSFSIGITFVSRWFPPEKQGTALGIYGAGNIGQSIAVFGAPVLAAAVGIQYAVWTFALAALIYAFCFFRFAEDAEWHQPSKNVVQAIASVAGSRMSWVLSMLYFQTFGGFVALALYMPMLLKETFSLSPSDAGFRTAVFVVLATACRPLGGWFSDRISATHLLYFVLAGLVPCAFMMVSSDLGYFTIGALGAAALVGVGNGAVFKLVPHFFPKDVGTVTGIVGAAGGMGGFFPPLILGYVKDHMGSYGPGFFCLAGYAVFCLVVLYFSIRKPKPAEPVVGQSGEQLAGARP